MIRRTLSGSINPGRRCTTMDNHNRKPNKEEKRVSSSVLYKTVDTTSECGDVRKEIIWTDEYIELFTEQAKTQRTRIFRISCGLITAMYQSFHYLPKLWEILCSSVKYFEDRVLFSTDHIVYCPVVVDSMARAAYRIYETNKVLESGEIWHIFVVSIVQSPFDIEIQAKLKPDYDRRHYYRIKQQHLKLYFERYCLERGVVTSKATEATQGDLEEEEYSALPPDDEMNKLISTSSKENDEEYWEGKKKPNYMLDAFIQELTYDKDLDKLIIRSIEKLTLEDYLDELQERQDNFSAASDVTSDHEDDSIEDFDDIVAGEKLTSTPLRIISPILEQDPNQEEQMPLDIYNISSPPPYDKYLSYLHKQPPSPNANTPQRSPSPVSFSIPAEAMRESVANEASKKLAIQATEQNLVAATPTKLSKTVSFSTPTRPTSKPQEKNSGADSIVHRRSVVTYNKREELNKKIDQLMQENQQRIESMYAEAQELMEVSSRNNTMNQLANNNPPSPDNFLNKSFKEISVLETKVLMIKETLSVKAEYRSAYSTNFIIESLTSDTKLGSYCTYCSPYDLKAIANNLTLLEITQLDQIEKLLPIHKNDPIDHIYIVLQGSVEVYTEDLINSARDDARIVQKFLVGDIIGENAFAEEDARWLYDVQTPSANTMSDPSSPTSSPYTARRSAIMFSKARHLTPFNRAKSISIGNASEGMCMIRLGVLSLSVLNQYIGMQSLDTENIMIYFWKSLRLYRHIADYNDHLLQKSFDYVKQTQVASAVGEHIITTQTSFQSINLTSSVRLRVYPIHTNIFEQNQSRYYMYLIKQGQASYFRVFPKEAIGEDVIPENVPLCEANYPVHTTTIDGEKSREYLQNEILSGDFSFMDSEDIHILDYMEEMEYIYYKLQKNHAHHRAEIGDVCAPTLSQQNDNEMQAMKKLEDYYNRKFHKFHHHKNNLSTHTRCEVFVIPLVEIAKYMHIFQTLLSLSNTKYPVLLLTNEDIIYNYYERLIWYAQLKDEVLEEVAKEKQDRRTCTDYFHAVENNENDALYYKRSAIKKKVVKVYDPFYYLTNEIANSFAQFRTNDDAVTPSASPRKVKANMGIDAKSLNQGVVELEYCKTLKAILDHTNAISSEQANIDSNEHRPSMTSNDSTRPISRPPRPSTASSTPNRSHRHLQISLRNNKDQELPLSPSGRSNQIKSPQPITDSASRPRTSRSLQMSVNKAPEDDEHEDESSKPHASTEKRRHGLLAQVKNVYDVIFKSEQLEQFKTNKPAVKKSAKRPQTTSVTLQQGGDRRERRSAMVQKKDPNEVPASSRSGGYIVNGKDAEDKDDENEDDHSNSSEEKNQKAFVSANRKKELMRYVDKQDSQPSSPNRVQLTRTKRELDLVQAKKNSKLLTPEQYVQMYKERLHGNPREQFAQEFNLYGYTT